MNEQPPISQEQETQEEKDERIAEDLQLKLEGLNNLKPSGDIAFDFNSLLELTERDSLYKKVDASENPHVILAGLIGIKTTWQEIMRDPNNVDITNEAKKLFYIDVPQAEIEMIDRFINFYSDKLSSERGEQENQDDDFEKYRESL